MDTKITVFILFIYFVTKVYSLGEYQIRVPNGYNCPCPPGQCFGTCAGIGHINDDGTAGCSGGDHPYHRNNQFGFDFQDYGNFNWTFAVCKQDSDGDGQSNGDELGDPCCIWKEGQTPTRTGRGNVSHPGFASSVVPYKSCAFDAPNLSITSVNATSSSIKITINVNNTCICSTTLEIKLVNESNYVPVLSLRANRTEYSILTLPPSTDYMIRVSVGNILSNISQEISASTLAVSPNAPLPPSTISLLFKTATAIGIVWSVASGATSYELDMARNSSNFMTVYQGPEISYQTSNLIADERYVFRVRSVNQFGVGASSAEFSFVTSASGLTTGLGQSVTTGYDQSMGLTTGGYVPPANSYSAYITPQTTPRAGELVPMSINLYDPSGIPILWSSLLIVQERKLSVAFFGGNGPYDIYGVVHPEDFNITSPPTTTFQIEFTFPKSGSFVIGIDFYLSITTRRRKVENSHITITMPFYVHPNLEYPDLNNETSTWTTNLIDRTKGYDLESSGVFTDSISVNDSKIIAGQSGLYATLTSSIPIYTRTCVKLLYSIYDNVNNAPIVDMRPYLSAAMDILIVNEFRNTTLHVYGVSGLPDDTPDCTLISQTAPNAIGPYIIAGVVFPSAGWYQIFSTINKNNTKVFVFSHSIYVAPLPPNVTIPLTPEDVKEGEYPYSLNALDDEFTLYWKMEANDIIQIAMVANTKGWVAIGFEPPEDGMTDCDMIIGYVDDDGIVKVLDTWSTGQQAPTEDSYFMHNMKKQHHMGSNDILEYNGTQLSSGVTVIKIRRKLVTGDMYDADIEDKVMNVAIAYNPSTDTLVTHGTRARTIMTVNFFTGETGKSSIITENEKLQLSHSLLMVLSWLFLAPLGIFIARFGHKWKAWFYLHIACMTTACVLSIIGLGVGVKLADNDFVQDNKLILIHSWLGLSVVIGGSILQPILGFIADKLYDPNRKKIPVWPDKIHWIIGRYSYLGAMINILLGMIYLDVDYYYFILFFIALIFTVFGYHIVDMGALFRKYKHPTQKESIELPD